MFAKLIAWAVSGFTPWIIGAVGLGVLGLWHWNEVRVAYNDGHADGVVEERKEWVDEVKKLRAQIAKRQERQRREIDDLADQYRQEVEEATAAHREQITDLNRILTEVTRDKKEGQADEKSPGCNCYDRPIDGRILRNLNQGR